MFERWKLAGVCLVVLAPLGAVACDSESAAESGSGGAAVSRGGATDTGCFKGVCAGSGGASDGGVGGVEFSAGAGGASGGAGGDGGASCPIDPFEADGTPCAPEGKTCDYGGDYPCGHSQSLECQNGEWVEYRGSEAPGCFPEGGAGGVGGAGGGAGGAHGGHGGAQ